MVVFNNLSTALFHVLTLGVVLLIYIGLSFHNSARSAQATRKRQDETNDVQIEIEKREGREEKTKYTNVKNARKKTARKGNTHTSGSQGARGGV